MWNAPKNQHQTLKHMTWALGTDICLIGVRRVRDNKNLLVCPHAENNSLCSLPVILFQNPMIKLLLSPSTEFTSVTLLQFETTVYIVPPHLIHPILIDLPVFDSVDFQNHSITSQDIFKIVQNSSPPPPFPFSIAIYSSFTVVKKTSIRQIKKTMIGFHQGNENQVNLFVSCFQTPQLCILNNLDTREKFSSFKNQFANSNRPTEGYRTTHENKCQSNKELLNQDHCICEHPDTERYFAPNRSSYKHLGNPSHTQQKIRMTYDFFMFSFCGQPEKFPV